MLKIPCLIMLVSFAPFTASYNKCPENEQLGNKRCNSCEPTCARPNPRICTKMACQSCECVPGLVRCNQTNKCVPLKKCPPPPYCLTSKIKCPENEQPGQKKCNGCEPCCDNLKPEICTERFCQCSCDCLPGLVRDKVSKKCVPQEKCPPPVHNCLCLVGEEPGQKSCQMCEPSCDNPKPERCAQTFAPCKCSCDCVPGLLRDKVSKKCVPPNKCPYQKKTD